MNHPVINATLRTSLAKGELNSLRREGKIPAVIYGGGQAASHIVLDAKEFKLATAGISESTIITIAIGKDKKEAFVRERQRASLSNEIIHVDFLEVVKGRSLHAKVHVHLVGIPVGVREGGVLETPAHEVEVECVPADLPEKIELDISGLQVNHSIHVRDIPAIKGVKILTSADLVLAAVKFAKAEVVAAPAAGEAAPAAGAAAPAAAAAAPAAEKKEEKK